MYNLQTSQADLDKRAAVRMDTFSSNRKPSTRPVILCVGIEFYLPEIIIKDLNNRYGKSYKILRCEDAEGTLECREHILSRNGKIALYIVCYNIEGMTGIELLSRLEAEAGKILLADAGEADFAKTAMNRQCFDYFLNKPSQKILFRNIEHILENRKRAVWSNLPSHIKTQINAFETPFFLYDLNKIESKVDDLTNFLRPDKIFYAVKCGSHPKILSTLKSKGCGFEVNNIGEMQKVIELGHDTKNILNSSPIASAKDVAYMFSKGVRHFAFDSKAQINNLKHNAPGSHVYLRIHSSNKGSRFNLSDRLGMTLDNAPELITYAKSSGLLPCGVTFHVGSQCRSEKNWEIALRKIAKLFTEFPELKIVNIGGGFPINYIENIPSVKEISKAVLNTIDKYFSLRPTLYVEPGRFIIGDTALTCTSVTQIEEREFFNRVVVDISVFCGLIELIEIGDHFQYPLETDAVGQKQLYQIGGPTCSGTDIIAHEVLLPKLKVDYRCTKNSSKIFILNTGAYTLDYIGNNQKHGFNGSPIPDIYFLKNGDIIKHEDQNHIDNSE